MLCPLRISTSLSFVRSILKMILTFLVLALEKAEEIHQVQVNFKVLRTVLVYL